MSPRIHPFLIIHATQNVLASIYPVLNHKCPCHHLHQRCKKLTYQGKKIKSKSSNTTDVDDYIKNAINTIVSGNNPAPNHSKIDVKAFCDFVECELSAIKNKQIFKSEMGYY